MRAHVCNKYVDFLCHSCCTDLSNMSMHICLQIDIRMYACMEACIHRLCTVCINILFLYIYIHVCVNNYVHVLFLRLSIRTYVFVCACACVCAYFCLCASSWRRSGSMEELCTPPIPLWLYMVHPEKNMWAHETCPQDLPGI